MDNNFSYFDEDLVNAMAAHKDKFTLIDARIANLVRSYSRTGQTFFASNKYLAEKCFTTPATIQKSINKLLAYNLITKKVACPNKLKQRMLTFNEEAANKFKQEAFIDTPKATTLAPPEAAS